MDGLVKSGVNNDWANERISEWASEQMTKLVHEWKIVNERMSEWMHEWEALLGLRFLAKNFSIACELVIITQKH